MTAAGGDPGRTSGHGSSQSVNKSGKQSVNKGVNKGVNFRGALRGMFRTALERLAADGVVGISAEELPSLIDQVRETADPKFGDYSGTMAMGAGKAGGTQAAGYCHRDH